MIYFREQSYSIEHIRKPKPNYLQLLISKNGQKTIVLGQTDHTNGQVQFIQDAIDAKLSFNCTGALAILNGKIDKEAKKKARTGQLEVWDDKKILKNLLPIHHKNLNSPELPGGEDLESALREMSASLGISSEDSKK